MDYFIYIRFVGFYVITMGILDFVQAKKIIFAASIAILLGSLMMIYQGLNGIDRANGFYGNPMIFATYLSVFLPIFFIAFFEKQVLGKYRWIAGLFFLIASLALIFNGTRGVWVAVIAVILPLMCYYILKNKKNLLICGLVIALVGGYFISDADNVKRFATINKPQLETARMCMWKSSFNMFLDHPLTGVGMGRWGDEYEKNYKLSQAKYLFNHPHNNFFLVLSTGGIIGLLGFVFMFGYLIYKSFKKFFISKDPYALMLVTSMLGFLIHGLTEANINTSIVVKYCFVVFAALVVLSIKYKEEKVE